MLELDGLPYVMKCVPEYIDLQGTLRAKINEWYMYYLATGDFYEHNEAKRVGDAQLVEEWKRGSLHPAQMVCSEMSGLIFNEGTRFATNGEGAGVDAANEWLQSWVIETDYQTACNKSAETACALGTSAQLLAFSDVADSGAIDPSGRVSIMRYDARNIFPVAFIEDTVTDVAFTSLASYKNGWAVQVSRVTKEDEGWRIRNRWFTYGGGDIDDIEELNLPEYAPEVYVPGAEPPFAILKPAGTNPYAVNSCMGVSVFDGAIPSIRLTDAAFQNFLNDIELGQKMVFLDEDMIKGDRDNRTLPFDIGKRLFVKVFRGIGGGASHIEEYNPDLRADQNAKVLSTALAVLGMRTGFGAQYWQFDKASHSIITATGEIMEQQALVRTITRHENSFTRPIQDMVTAMLHALGFEGASVRLQFDDSVIIDSEAKRNADRQDVAAGLMPAWRYIKEWRGVDDDEAKQWVAETMALAAL